jgi:hypothetical protein
VTKRWFMHFTQDAKFISGTAPFVFTRLVPLDEEPMDDPGIKLWPNRSARATARGTQGVMDGQPLPVR